MRIVQHYIRTSIHRRIGQMRLFTSWYKKGFKFIFKILNLIIYISLWYFKFHFDYMITRFSLYSTIFHIKLVIYGLEF